MSFRAGPVAANMRAMLIISSLAGAADAFARHRPSRVISLLCEEEKVPEFPGLDPKKRLLLYVDQESCAATITRAATDRAREIVDFARGWDGRGDVMIHCNRGVARSTAAAFIIMCIREPQTPEAELMTRLRKVAPHADPCPMLVSYADEILDRNGRMIDALDDLCPPSTAISAPVAFVTLAA